MKRVVLVLVLLALSISYVSAQIVKMTELPSDKEFRKAVKTIMYRTNGHDYTQLNPQQKVGIFIPHIRVGLGVQKAINKFHPHHIFMSHIQELGHSIRKWRWTFDDALRLCEKWNHDHLWIPCWGERVIYNRNSWK